jgi:hypothetical protein
MTPPYFNSHLSHSGPLSLTMYIPPALQYKTRRWGNTSLSLCSHFLHGELEMFLSPFHLPPTLSLLYPVILKYILAKTFTLWDSLFWDTLKCLSHLWISRTFDFAWRLRLCGSPLVCPLMTIPFSLMNLVLWATNTSTLFCL